MRVGRLVSAILRFEPPWALLTFQQCFEVALAGIVLYNGK